MSRAMKYGGVGKTMPSKLPKTAPKALDPHNHDWELHEDDRKMMLEGAAYGVEHAAAFAEEVRDELAELIGTYSDAEAEARLAALRERFVAALFVDPDGIYPELVADCWDATRDARRYAGPRPVVAHPPCQLWVNFAALNFKRYGGEHNRPGNDGGCFDFAVRAVTQWGGVLEHPAFSNAWKAHSIPAPTGIGWTRHGRREWVCEVWQSAYGHPARKRTWLFYSGENPPSEGRWDRPSGTHQVGWFDRIKPTLSKKEASRTPLAFAQWLIRLAAHSESQATRGEE